ncbi:alpha/beta hydrolase family protein [Actinopolymorpha sp. NPDC004070]|uniref:alpha/beta hydrolase family protein n=1 Tax=Actinopolymorpha sp. NPDC004070 TaxID=3154548 RepID=UPI0033A84354
MEGRAQVTEESGRLWLSPSDNHRYLVQHTIPALRFTGGDAAAWQARLRPKVRELLGMPEPSALPLRVRTLWRSELELGTVEKVAFAAEPHADVVAYFCVPYDRPAPYPTVICLQGHSTGMHVSIARERDDESAPFEVEGDRDFALGAMRHGFAALCIEQRSFGYRREQVQSAVSPHGCHDAAMQALLLGRTLVGERVFDVDRGIDYLAERGDVDLSCLGVMGNSGGGTATIYAAAVLDRVRFAMPSCALCTFADSIMSIYHCADNYVPGILRWAEAADVLGLFAPKPLVVVAGRDDAIFPLTGVRRAFDDLRKIYAASGADQQCRLVIGDGGHRFYEKQAWQALLEVLG